MKYRINGHILFDADIGSLNLKDFADDPLPISNPSKRLLLLLIAHRGEPVTREVIFRKVWDEYGMISSNNNLNQCVSKLRRMLKMMGINEEVIITVPKVGFMLSQNIAIEYVEEPVIPLEKQEPPIAPLSSEAKPQTAKELDGSQYSKRALRYWTAVCGGLAAIAVLAIGITLFATGKEAQEERFIGEVGNCKVFVSTSTRTVAATSAFNRDVLAYADSKMTRCKSDEYLLGIHSSRPYRDVSEVSRLFMLKCKAMQDQRIEVCYGLHDEQ